jgi:hypothetical protein
MRPRRAATVFCAIASKEFPLRPQPPNNHILRKWAYKGLARDAHSFASGSRTKGRKLLTAKKKAAPTGAARYLM